MLCFIHEYQTLVVGVLATAGVMVTLWWNARLARDQHSRNANLARDQRLAQIAHERDVLRTAMRAELENLRDMFTDRIATISKALPEDTGILLPVNTFTDVYVHSIDRLGLLSDLELRTVLKAYHLAREVPDRLRLIQGSRDSQRDSPGYVYVRNEWFEATKKLHENFLGDIGKAIAALH
jgi:hypothetical protein